MSLFSSVTNKILLGLQYTPYVTQAVQAIQASNANLPGATKKQLVLSAIQAATKTGETVPEQHVQIISVLIDLVCSILFPKSAAAPAPLVPVPPAHASDSPHPAVNIEAFTKP